MKAPKLSRGAQRMLDLLRWYGARFDRIFVFQKKLAAHLGVKVRQLQRYIAELRAFKLADGKTPLITVQKCGRHAAEYELAPEAVATKNVVSKTGLRRVEARSPLI